MTFNPSNGSSEFSRYCIVPNYSYIKSRSAADITYSGFNPVMSANMTSITGSEMIRAITMANGIAVVPRFMPIHENVDLLNSFKHRGVWASVGVGSEEYERAIAILQNTAVSRLVIDVAHGASEHVAEFVNDLRSYIRAQNIQDIKISVGNFVSHQSVGVFYRKTGITSYKVGIGSGETCTTRLKTGVGYPQILAVNEIRNHFPDFEIISDGGHQSPGDIAKSIAAGANLVMLGSMLARTTEAAGRGTFYGSASARSYKEQNKQGKYITDEGIEKEVLVNTSVDELMLDICGGLRSAFSYVGAKDMPEFHRYATLLDTFSGQKIFNRADL
jgi:IMP dehydrogenase/GMP reductase